MRDITFWDNIVDDITREMQGAPERKNGKDGLPFPPFAVYNIGNSNHKNLLDLVNILQEEIVRAGVSPENYNIE